MSTAHRGSSGRETKPLVIAHRGASASHPENTVEAFVAARALGADWVELDVRATADGELVVHHDAQLPGGRAIAELDLGELPATVATLDQALDACAGMGVNVEIKADPADPACQLAQATAARLTSRAQRSARASSGLRGQRFDQLLVSSFDPASIAVVRDLEPRLATAALGFDVGSLARWVSETASAGHAAVNPWDPLVDAALVGAAHAEGLSVYPWTVDDPARMAELVGMGVDGIITNVPDVARDLIDAS